MNRFNIPATESRNILPPDMRGNFEDAIRIIREKNNIQHPDELGKMLSKSIIAQTMVNVLRISKLRTFLWQLLF